MVEKNSVLPYKDPRTLQVDFPYYDWKKFFDRKFLICSGIRGWRMILITDHPTDLFVTDDLEAELRSVKVMKEVVVFDLSPQIILPVELSEERVSELSYFKSFVVDEHKQYISSNY